MINHFLTLLNNIGGEYIPETTRLYDEYIPVYSAATLPKSLVPVEHVLFSECSDSTDRRQKAYQLLYLVYGSDLSYALYEKDTRTTYRWPDHFEPNAYCGSLITSTESLPILSEACLAPILVDEDVRRYFYDAGTFVDKLAALTVAYVRKMDAER